MGLLVESAAWLGAMALLTCASGFFSGSEAALFFLSQRDRAEFAGGSTGQRTAARLLDDPERLLGAILFGNLLINISYFAVAAVLGQRWGGAASAALAVGSLAFLAVFGELLPKSLAVLRPRQIAPLVSMPLAVAVRVIDPLLPALRTVNLLSQRLLLPGLAREPYLELTDIEQAVELATSEEERAQERRVLANIVGLADLRVDEIMRPRTHLRTFRPPVRLSDLAGNLTPSGYLLLTEPASDEIAASVALKRLANLPDENLERYAEDVFYVPWTAKVAQALDTMQETEHDVAVVVNEYGETIGAVTYEDILHLVFSSNPSPSMRFHRHEPIVQTGQNVWQVLGLTPVRRLVRDLNLPVPQTTSVTLAGVIQEELERIPNVGDTGAWNGLAFKVLAVPEQGPIVVELQRPETAETEAPG